MKYKFNVVKSNMTEDEVKNYIDEAMKTLGLFGVNSNGGLLDFPTEFKIGDAYYTYNCKKKLMTIRTKSRKMSVVLITTTN